MAEHDAAITDYAAGLYLRYFRAGILAGATAPIIDLRRDVDLLRGHWAVSAPVREFLTYLLTHRHEAQSLLLFKQRIDDAVARGRIDARATVLMRMRSGLPSAVVAEEPVRSFNTGPNQLVAWVVHHATLHASRLLDLQPAGSAYLPLIEDAMGELAAVKRIDALREPLKLLAANRRPGPGTLRDAARSRRMIYRLAVAAYNTLSAMEAGEDDAIKTVVTSTLIAPLEVWRRFELAVAIGIGTALSDETGERLKLNILGASAGEPIMRCGRFSVYWQTVTGHYTSPAPEPSEIRLAAALAAYGMNPSSDRPDLVIVDEPTGRVVSVIEVKYLAGDTANARFREANGQIVRYARGYVTGGSIDDLVRRSLVALSADAPALLDDTAPAPAAVDFAAMQEGSLRPWIRERLLPSL